MKCDIRHGTNAPQTAKNINEVFGDNVVNKQTVGQWFERFQSGDFVLENQPCGRPATKIDNNELKAVVEEDTSQIMCALAERFNDLILAVLYYLKHIRKIKKLENWVQHELKEHQMTYHLETCVSCCLDRTQNHFCTILLLVIKTGFFSTIANVQQDVWIKTKSQNTLQNQSFI